MILDAGSILDFAQLDSGLVELSHSPLNICDMMESCIDMVWPDALKKGLEVTVSAPRAAMANTVLGDGLRIRQVLVHLLSNAVKFTDQGSVEIDVEAEETAAGLQCALKVSSFLMHVAMMWVVDRGQLCHHIATHRPTSLLIQSFIGSSYMRSVGAQVKDTGVGVPESFRAHLFNSFTQATESCTRTHGGLGLGLAICFNLAKLMHADLSLSNREGGGTTATLSLCMPLAVGSCGFAVPDADFSSGSMHEYPDATDASQSAPSSGGSASNRNSTDSSDSSNGGTARVGARQLDTRSVFVSENTMHGQLAPFSSAPDEAVSLHGTDTSIPQLLADPRIRLLQKHTAVIHVHSMVLSRQLRCACSALGMAVIDMPVISSPQSLQVPDGACGQPCNVQLQGTPILLCNATDAAQALRNGWKKHAVVALCVDGHLSPMLHVHVSPVSIPVRLRGLISAVLLALHGGPGKDSLLYVPLGTPHTVAKNAAVACTAGFGGTACGFCTRCQRSTDAEVAAVRSYPAPLQ